MVNELVIYRLCHSLTLLQGHQTFRGLYPSEWSDIIVHNAILFVQLIELSIREATKQGVATSKRTSKPDSELAVLQLVLGELRTLNKGKVFSGHCPFAYEYSLKIKK